jgi:CMP-N-acetylneuraminic acid synthetase
MKSIAIIPARLGSKRIKHKNIIDFNGKPMIFWTIKAALESQLFDKVVVSTDSQKIAQISKENGAEVPFFREKYNDDYTPISDVTIHCVNQSEKYWNEKYDIVTQLMANCPNRNAEEIRKAYNYFIKNNIDFLSSCIPFQSSNPWWAFSLKKNNQPEYLFYEKTKKRSQDLQTMYCRSGAIWIARKNKLIAENSFFGLGHVGYPIRWSSGIDIDDNEDLKIAERISKL